MNNNPSEASRDGLPLTPKLARIIGFPGSIAIVVGTIIGSGIFLVPHNMALALNSPGSLLLVWVIGGALALAGALSLGELGAAMPHAGGVYVYLREAFGPLPAFLYGWGLLLVMQSGSIATLAVGFGIYSGAFLPIGPAGQKWVACGLVAFLTGVNILGTRQSTWVQTTFTVAKLAGLAVLTGAAFFYHPASRHPAVPMALSSKGGMGAWGEALVGVLWAYEGWHMLSFTAGEVRNPSRILPRSYLLGTTMVIAAYLLANVAYLKALGMAGLTHYERVAAETMQLIAGPRGAMFVSALILCSIFGATNGTILTGPRVYFAMAEDRLFFRAARKLHPRFGTPALAIAIQGAWSVVLAASGSYEQLYTYVIFCAWIFYGLAVAGLIVLRRRAPQLERPYKVWGYPVLPALFCVAALLVALSTLRERPLESLVGIVVILAGAPVYFALRRFARPA
ncbi:MAG: APC family permease [Terriglobia bacterium]